MKRLSLMQWMSMVALTACIGCSAEPQPGRAPDPSLGDAGKFPDEVAVAEVSEPADAAPDHGSEAQLSSFDTTTPDGAVLHVMRGVAAGRPQVAWEALPKSYQDDVHEVIHTFAENTDAELWKRSIQVLEKLANTVQDQKALIVKVASQQQPNQDPKQLEQAIDGFVSLAQSITTGELGDLERLKTLDVGEFLAGSGAGMLKTFQALAELSPQQNNGLEFFAKGDVKLVSHDGDHAVVSLQAPDEPAREVKLTRVDGKWLPASLVESWDQKMGEMKTAAAKPSELTDQQRQQIHAMLDTLDGGLDRVAAAETEQEFQVAFQQMAGQVMGMMMGGGFGGPGQQPATPNSPSFPTPSDEGEQPESSPTDSTDEPGVSPPPQESEESEGTP